MPDQFSTMNTPIQLSFERFNEPGLYLLFTDGLVLNLTLECIHEIKHRYLNDPKLLPPSIRSSPDYAPCSVCPKRQSALICHAIPTVFPFLNHMDRFLSNETVLAIYRPEPFDFPDDATVLHMDRAPVERALQFISILSLIYHCEVGRTYTKYFAGVVPFMDPGMIAERVYLNIYWDLRGDLPAVNALMAKMRHEFDITVQCQMDRLRLFCANEAFLDAFVMTHITTQFLDAGIESRLRKTVKARIAPDLGEDSDEAALCATRA